MLQKRLILCSLCYTSTSTMCERLWMIFMLAYVQLDSDLALHVQQQQHKRGPRNQQRDVPQRGTRSVIANS